MCDVPEGMKRCSKCGEVKALTEFHTHKARKDGRTSLCKLCAIIASRRWYAENKTRAAETNRVRYERDKSRILETCKRWAERHADVVKETKARWKKNHPEAEKSFQKKAVAELRDTYVRLTLRANKDVCSSEFIEAKRALLIRYRENRTIKKTINKLKEAVNANANG